MAITLDGTLGITTPDLTDSSLTATRVVYAGASGNLTGSANLVFDGSTLTSTTTTAAGVVLDTSTAGKANITLKSAGSQKAIIGLSGAILGTTATDAALFAETGGAIKLYANGAVTNSGTFNQYGFGIGAAVPSSGQGITFPAAQDASSNANTLDDYEEGTWTPTNPNVSLNSASGTYTKIGRYVYLTFYAEWPTTSDSNQIVIGGLPFTTKTQTAGTGGGSIAYNGSNTDFYISAVSNSTSLYTYQKLGATPTNANLSTKSLTFSISYIV